MLMESKRVLPKGLIVTFTFNPDTIVWYQPDIEQDSHTRMMPINGPDILLAEPYDELVKRIRSCR